MAAKLERIERISQMLREGPILARETAELMEVSQPTISRLLSRIPNLLPIGDGPKRQYALSRGSEIYPIVKVTKEGEIIPVGEIHLIEPSGAALIPAKNSGMQAEIYEDVPFFIWDIRPQGYLGRIFISQNEDLKLPERWEDWKKADLYRTLNSRGDDLVGNLVIGNESLSKLQQRKHSIVLATDRKSRYPQLAEQTLQGTHIGSSAGGEQPKFTTLIQDKKNYEHVIVKFSPPIDSEAGIRWADLLYAEDIALKTLQAAGYSAASSSVLESENRVFLEVKRFDRVGIDGRKGVISIGAIDDEYLGSRRDWSLSSEKLREKKLITEKDKSAAIFLDCFGIHIANTDRHFGNLSFYWEPGKKQLELAPVYDMLPMFYAPSQGNVVNKTYKMQPAAYNQLSAWKDANNLAIEYWEKVHSDERISETFKSIASDNLKSQKTKKNI